MVISFLNYQAIEHTISALQPFMAFYMSPYKICKVFILGSSIPNAFEGFIEKLTEQEIITISSRVGHILKICHFLQKIPVLPTLLYFESTKLISSAVRI